MSDQPTVSVIVPVWNDEIRIQQCVAALESQSYPSDRYEVIVVDNGSDTPVRSLLERFPHARVTEEPEPGSYRARNTGLALATGEVIAFTDSDCVPAADWLENGVAALQGTANSGLVGGAIELVVHDEARPTAVELYERVFAFPQERYVKLERWAATANVFTYRQVVDAVGGFDPARLSGGDREWGVRVAAAGYPLVFAEDVRVQHPARRTTAELKSKVLRTTGAGYTPSPVPRQGSKRAFVRGLARNVFPARSLIRVWRSPAMRGPGDSLKASSIVLLVGYLRAWESIRLRLGGTPVR